MSELSSDAKALIEQGRISSEPNPHDKARVRARLVSELGASAFAGVALASSAVGSTELAAATAKAAKTAAAWWLKGLVALSAVAGGTVALYATQPAQLAPEERAARVHAPLHEQRRTSEPATPPAPAAPPAVTALELRAEQATTTPEHEKEPPPNVRRRTKEAPIAAAKPSNERPQLASKAAAAPANDGLRAELVLLARAQRELREGRASGALALARRHAAEFPSGALGEERDGIETLARCMLGEANEAHARAFLARAASSPLAARVRKECGVK